MNRTVYYFFLLFCFSLGGVPLLSGNEVKSPFVSQIKVAVRGPQVKITWKDSPDTPGSLLIFRSKEEITSENFSQSTLAGIVPPGTEYFIDTPGEVGSYFYAILIQSGKDALHTELIPFRNKTITPVVLENIADEQERGAKISSIKAEVVGNSIVVRFVVNRGDRELILYRSSSPILSIEQLYNATEVQRFPSSTTEYTDHPIPGIPYYYAVVDARLLEMKNPQLEPGNNTTLEYVEIPLPSEGAVSLDMLPPLPAERVRPLPLPYFLLQRSVETGQKLPGSREYGIPEPFPLSPITHKIIKDLTDPHPRTSLPTPSPLLLDTNKAAGDIREEYMLQTILSGPFKQRNWGETILQIDLFLRLPLSSDIRNQAYFYRGQARFFTEQYREAFMDFLIASSQHYAECTPWIDKILQILKEEGRE